MKKVLFMTAIFCGTLAFTSCSKKDYTCECTMPASLGVAAQTTNIPITDAKKGDAEDACDASSATYAIGGGSCTLK